MIGAKCPIIESHWCPVASDVCSELSQYKLHCILYKNYFKILGKEEVPVQKRIPVDVCPLDTKLYCPFYCEDCLENCNHCILWSS